MESISANGYNICFNEPGYEALNILLFENRYSSIFILTDSNTNEQCLPSLLENIETEITVEIIEIEPGEQVKNIETCAQLWNVLTELGADRKSLLINLGGGVITDLGGFVASAFKRGIDFIHVPTTLLGMIDAAIGGKNGVDLGHLKNQVGFIAVPKLLLVDTAYLLTLPQRQLRSGLAEMLKHGLIYDKAYWEEFLDLSKIDFADFDRLIYRSIQIKNDIVSSDPTEKGIRKALNFGHTLGHAIESHFLGAQDKAALLHGEAIAAGMVLESYVALRKGLLSEQEYSEIKTALAAVFETIAFSQNDLEAILELLIHDKKNEYGTILFALLDGIGKIRINELVENELIIEAFNDYKS
jgi:3-dehydroquinate synthase